MVNEDEKAQTGGLKLSKSSDYERKNKNDSSKKYFFLLLTIKLVKERENPMKIVWAKYTIQRTQSSKFIFISEEFVWVIYLRTTFFILFEEKVFS